MDKIFIVILLLLIPKTILGINNNHSDSTIVKKYSDKALTFFNENQNDSSIIYYNKLANIYLDNKNWKKYISTNNSLSKIHQKLIEYDKAEKFLQENILIINSEKIDSLASEVGTSYNILGTLAFHKGLYEKAIKYSEKSIHIYKQSKHISKNHLAILYTNLGVLYNKKKNYKKSLTYHNQSIDYIGQNIRFK